MNLIQERATGRLQIIALSLILGSSQIWDLALPLRSWCFNVSEWINVRGEDPMGIVLLWKVEIAM